MAQYEFAIGLTAETMTNVEELATPLMIPDWTFSEASRAVTLASGVVRALGFPEITWHWGFLEAAERDLLRTLCPGKSAAVYVRTPVNDLTNRTFAAQMVWPEGEDPTVGIVRDVTISFRHAVMQDEESV